MTLINSLHTLNHYGNQTLIESLQKLALMILFFGWYGLVSAQYHSDFSTGSLLETLYEVEHNSCSDSIVVAGIKNMANGNSNLDQVVFAKASSTGIIDNPMRAFPPANWNIFKTHPNVELLGVTDPQTGDCDGYILVVSYTQNDIDYNLHIMRLDENLNKICEASPLQDNTHSEYINGIVQDADGTIVMVGTRETGSAKNLLLMRMDLNCNVINIKEQAMVVDINNNQAEGISITNFEDPWGVTSLKYAIVGHVGNYSFMSTVHYNLDLNQTEVWDIDADNTNNERAVDIIQLGSNVYICGRGEGSTEEDYYTYFTRANFVGFQASLSTSMLKYRMPNESNYPTDMESSIDGDHMVIGGVRKYFDPVFPEAEEPYLMEVTLTGNVHKATSHKGHHNSGRTLDVTKNNANQYLIAGMLGSTPDIANKSHFMVQTDDQLESTTGCFEEIRTSTVRPDVSFLDVDIDAQVVILDDNQVSFPVSKIGVQQSFCEAPEPQDCNSAIITATFSYTQAGLNYTFTSNSTTSLGAITQTNWKVIDPDNIVIHTSTSNPMSYTFSMYDTYTIILEIEVTLPDGTLCYASITKTLCPSAVTQRTFHVVHDIAYDFIPYTHSDWSVAGLQNSSGEYVTFGIINDFENGSRDMYHARYNKKGANISAPVREQIFVGTADHYIPVDMKERLTPSGKNGGYLALVNRLDLRFFTSNFDLMWLSPTGVISEVEEFCSDLLNTYSAADMIVHGDTVVITGNVFEQRNVPFIMIYDHVLKNILCMKTLETEENREVSTVVQQISPERYAIAGIYDEKQAFYMEFDASCGTMDAMLVKDVDNNPLSKDVPVQIVVSEGSVLVTGTTGYSEEHNIFVWEPYTQESYIYNIEDKGSKLTDAAYLPNGRLLLAGSTNLLPNGNWDQANQSKGFMMEVDPSGVYWSHIYDSEKFPVTHIAQVDIDRDRGIFATGWSLKYNEQFDIDSHVDYLSKSWIIKTDVQGRIHDCQCYKDVKVEMRVIPQSGSKPPLTSYDRDCDGSPQQHLSAGIQTREYVCDRFCPDDCCYEYCADTIDIAQSYIAPGYYHADLHLSATGIAVYGIDSIDLKSGVDIMLEEGFEVETGDALTANIETCTTCCDMDDPINELPWMISFPDIGDYNIIRYQLTDGCVFTFDYCGYDEVYYYNCEGQLICQNDPLNGIGCPPLSPVTIETLQGCM